MFKYMVIVYSAAALFLLPCCSKKDAIEGKQAGEAVSSVPVTQPGEAEFNLVRSRLAACAPSEGIKSCYAKWAKARHVKTRKKRLSRFSRSAATSRCSRRGNSS